jgi:hypothetical protein
VGTHGSGRDLGVGLARSIHICCVYGISGRDITQSTVIYSEYMVLANPIQVSFLDTF